ncbi:BTAD domain-containing putative transcriptional regulator [Actinoplanes sp. NPDC049599]|uniref:AfsR/SARP family transcriptional regulator n=1 Tax=Actinoplanes sp. NPDC049599 TaxID=3363903 RepID=UPI003790FC9A
MGTEIRLLGPVEVRADGLVFDIGEPRRRTVLAALLVDAGRVVPSTTLVERVWGESPPGHAIRTLGSHVSRIRRVLERAATAGSSVAVVKFPGGYRLDVDRNQVDLHLFRRLVRQARDAGCSDQQRAELLRQAIALWRGEPLTGLAGDWAERIREHLGRERLDAVAAWAEAEVRVGNPGEVLGMLPELAEAHPLLEPLTAALMRAMITAGRPSEALELCRTHRRRLADEYGTDQSADLQKLYEAILRGELAAAVAPTPTPAAVVPVQLPVGVPGFAGRVEELARLDALPADHTDRTTVICAVSGAAGVGKTTLAVRAARRMSDRFPDGQLYLDLRGFDPAGAPVEPGEGLRTFLDAFDVPPGRIPMSLDAKAGLYRSLLAGRRVLVVLDNARDSAQVRPLLPATPGCLVLITSRNRLAGLVATGGIHHVELALFTHDEAYDLLSRRLGEARLAAEPQAVEEIISRCAGLPLGMAIVAAQAVVQPRRPLTAIAAQLRQAPDTLDAFSSGDPAADVRTVFSWSYEILSDGAARLFRLLALAPGPATAEPAVASLAGLPVSRVRASLAELVGAHLIIETGPGRYAFHDLLRAYALELVKLHDGYEQRLAAIRRVLDHYLHTAYAAERQLQPAGTGFTMVRTQPGVEPEKIADRERARAWFGAQRSVLLAAVDLAATWGLDQHAWQLAATFRTYFKWQGLWREWLAAQQTGLAAALRTGERDAQAAAYRALALALIRLARYDEAESSLKEAVELHTAIGDQVGQAHAHLNLGEVYVRQGLLSDALRHAEEALDLYRQAGNEPGQANSLNNIGWLYAQLGDHRTALRRCGLALALHRRTGDRQGQATTWDSLGYTRHIRGEYAAAVECYQRALDMYRELGDRYYEATVRVSLGDTYSAAGDRCAADAAYQQALTILDDLDHPDAAGVRARLEGARTT